MGLCVCSSEKIVGSYPEIVRETPTDFIAMSAAASGILFAALYVAGKSTLLKIIWLVERADSGEYLLDGKDIAKCSDMEAARIRNSKISFVMQDFALINQFTVLENTELPLLLSKEKIQRRSAARWLKMP